MRKYLPARIWRRLALLLCCMTTLTACVDTEEFDDTRNGNFEALWKIIDEHYCFFNYKQHEYGLNWDAVYAKYKVRVSEQMTETQLFEVLCDMLAELRDGHVNLSTSYDYGRYWKWQENYPQNYSDTLERKYLGTDYKIAGGLRYKVLDDNIGYIRYESFSSPFGEGNLDDILSYFALCRGLIIDIRSNGGGSLGFAEMLTARFIDQKTLVGYIQHKTGKGRYEFSDLEPYYIEPSRNLRWHKPVCVLTNRGVFSAANQFASMMQMLPQVKLVGDHTGGGSGLPMSNSLPNGWVVRYSACPIYNVRRQHTEFGIEPDVKAALSDDDVQRGVDSIIEAARRVINS